MTSDFRTPTEELLLIAETLGEVKSKTDKLEAEFQTQTRPLEAATNAVSAAISGIKALQFHVLDNNLGKLSERVEEMRKAINDQVDVIALQLKKADEDNATKFGQDTETLRAAIADLQANLGMLSNQFSSQLERVKFEAKEEAKKLQLIPGPEGAAGASLNPRGTFVEGQTYNRLDVVSFLGSSYIAAVDGVTEKPSKNSNQWQVLASRGSGGAGGVSNFGSISGVAQINQGGTGQTTRNDAVNALLPTQNEFTEYRFLRSNGVNAEWSDVVSNLISLGGVSCESGFSTIANVYAESGVYSEFGTIRGYDLMTENVVYVKQGQGVGPSITGYAQIFIDNSDGDLKIKFGNGTTKTIATDT